MRKYLPPDPNRICQMCGKNKVWAPRAQFCKPCLKIRKEPPVVITPKTIDMCERHPCGKPQNKIPYDGLPLGRYVLSQAPTPKFLKMVERILEARG